MTPAQSGKRFGNICAIQQIKQQRAALFGNGRLSFSFPEFEVNINCQH
jgi:hypothetical protein